MSLALEKRNRFAAFANYAPPSVTGGRPDVAIAAFDIADVAEKQKLERAVGIATHPWTDDDESELFGESAWVAVSDDETEVFAESEWTRTPTKRTQNKWRNTKTGAIKYSPTNPGKGKGAKSISPNKPSIHKKHGEALKYDADNELLRNAKPKPAPAKAESKPDDPVVRGTPLADDATIDPLTAPTPKDIETDIADLEALLADTPEGVDPTPTSAVAPKILDAVKTAAAKIPERTKALVPVVAKARADVHEVEKSFEGADAMAMAWENAHHNDGKNDGFFDAISDAATFNIDGLVKKYGIAGAVPILLTAATGGIAGAAGVGSGTAGMFPDAVKAGAMSGAAILSLPALALIHSIRGVKRLIFGHGTAAAKGGKSTKAITHAETHDRMTDEQIARATAEMEARLAVECFKMARSRGLM